MGIRKSLVAGCAVVGFAPAGVAADASWTAVTSLAKGTSQNCGGGQSDWRVEIKGTTLKYGSMTTNYSYSVDLKALQPDGAGKVTAKDDKNREFYVTFEPGMGPRPFQVANSITPCVWLFTPKK